MSHRAIFILSATGYSALAIVLTYPLVRHLSTTLPHDIGDPLLGTTLLWWNAHTVPLSQTWWQAFFFWPSQGALALSDHRLGESLLATPVQWAGVNAVTAYNLTLLATFPLSALAAQWLAWTIVRRHDVAILCGLAYGFCPYRVAHLQHLELLSGFGMPAALAALHHYRATLAPKWLAAFSAALVVQALCSLYYALFFSVFLAIWIAWFIGWRDRARLAAVGLGCAAAGAALLPLGSVYERVHSLYGLSRSFDEIVRLSADVMGFGAASPLSALWGWTAPLAPEAEGELFPGLTIAALAAAGAVLLWRRNAGPIDRIDRWLAAAPLVAAVCAAIACCGWLFGPWRIDLGLLTVSSEPLFKPLSIALVALTIWIGASSRVRLAYARQSAFAFYMIAAAILFVCCLGPKPAIAGHQIFYEPVYRWLLELPFFGSVRVPARFAMPAMLALSVSGALAFNALVRTPRTRAVLALAAAAGIVADGWIGRLPLQPLPETWPPSRAAGYAAVLELPLGSLYDDVAAMYRATAHGRPVVNGYSGWEPTHYHTLRVALQERDAAALDGLPSTAPLLAVVDRRKDADHSSEQFLLTTATRVWTDDDRWTLFSVAPRPSASPICPGESTSIASIVTSDGPLDALALTDGDPSTRWVGSHAQQAGDALILDLGRPVHPCAVVMSIGSFRANYPRQLAVDVSMTGTDWTTVTVRRTAGLTIRGALDDPKHVPIAIPIGPAPARFLRLRIAESHPTVPWVVADLDVRVANAVE